MQYLEDKVSCINGELYYNKFIWQQNLLVGCYGTFKMPPGRLDFWCPKGKKRDPPNSKPKSQRSELKWLWKYLKTPNFCVKFQPNLLTTTFAPGTFSQTMTLEPASQCLLFLKTNSRQENRSKPSFTVRIITKYSLERFLSICGEKMPA